MNVRTTLDHFKKIVLQALEVCGVTKQSKRQQQITQEAKKKKHLESLSKWWPQKTMKNKKINGESENYNERRK